jgi:hypothetical protein
MKKLIWIFGTIILILLLAIAYGSYLNNKNQESIILPAQKNTNNVNPSAPVINNKNSWPVYNNSVLGISFPYPPDFKAQQGPFVIGDYGTVLVGSATAGITIKIDEPTLITTPNTPPTSSLIYYSNLYEQVHSGDYTVSNIQISGYPTTVITVPVQGEAGGHAWYGFDAGNRFVSIEANYLNASTKTALDEMVADMKVSTK